MAGHLRNVTILDDAKTNGNKKNIIVPQDTKTMLGILDKSVYG